MAGSKRGERRGGRQKGTPNKATAEIRKYAQQYTKDALDGLASIARTSESDAARVSAWNSLLDRGHGKPSQAYTGEGGEGPITFIVETGIERE